MHSAEDWDDLLVPEIERQQAAGKRVAFRADAAFANVGSSFLGDPNVELVQVWLFGETGELLIQMTMGPLSETPLIYLAFKTAPNIQPVWPYPKGAGPSEEQLDAVHAALNALFLRHRETAPGVH